MTKREVKQKIKSILEKDPKYKDAKIIITFKDRKENQNENKQR